jgi:hypothetical protein
LSETPVEVIVPEQPKKNTLKRIFDDLIEKSPLKSGQNFKKNLKPSFYDIIFCLPFFLFSFLLNFIFLKFLNLLILIQLSSGRTLRGASKLKASASSVSDHSPAVLSSDEASSTVAKAKLEKKSKSLREPKQVTTISEEAEEKEDTDLTKKRKMSTRSKK